MKNQRLVEALKEMDKAIGAAYWSAVDSPYWSAVDSPYWSAVGSAKINENEVLEILKSKLTAKEQKK